MCPYWSPALESSPEVTCDIPTSHVDLIPTLLGLAGIDVEQATAGWLLATTRPIPLPGRDLSGIIRGTVALRRWNRRSIS